jgi:ubiquinone/menaquinone biosynthesis C-methylase UbiE
MLILPFQPVFMKVEEAYTDWSQQYDTNQNRTRDLEAVAIQTVLEDVSSSTILEAGCGTGKNTPYLLAKAKESLLSIDLTAAMLEKARQKVDSPKVSFLQADITQPWHFTQERFNLVTFSLVLEHIEKLDFVFEQAAQKLLPGGHVYIGELHPFKQYSGTKARFATEQGTTEVECYQHHLSDFVQAGLKQGWQLKNVQEFFDAEDSGGLPRILALLFVAPQCSL